MHPEMRGVQEGAHLGRDEAEAHIQTAAFRPLLRRESETGDGHQRL
jgi:hypothetical protein